ncbi:MAG: carbohydrate-binding protein [Planctomycetaceae bacterium]|nr:carbohydrate-binding protein [Planctomycetaceae bacterium]
MVIKGSEIVKGWQKAENDAWKVTIPNSFFGEFNPYSDRIQGDWFNGKRREHHTGAVYFKGDWLVESASLENVLKPVDSINQSRDYLLNISWLQIDGQSRIDAAGFSCHQGVQTAECSEGGKCIGWIQSGDWVSYKGVDFGPGAEKLTIRTASASRGGIVEVRQNSLDGSLLGTCTVSGTGGWQTWSTADVKLKPTVGTQTLYLVFRNYPPLNSADNGLWFAKVDDSVTTIWAQFPGVNPNESEVEINVRQSVFYPDKPGRNYITIRGFTLMQAATPWAPPTAEQIGLLGTNWSRGWIIENNEVVYSTCTGITLGKHGDQYDNTSQNSAEGYVETIKRGLEQGWSKENIGSHIVRNNRIAFCEQAGIAGSLGAAFSTITGNEIHDIHVRQLFGGAEMAGIKFHGAIDTLISRNHIYRCNRGIWLDWMAQGARVTQNLLHDNQPSEDIYMEVNHGPFLFDNNVLLSRVNLWDMSEGGAFVHNLFGGRLNMRPDTRRTPYHPAHSTSIAGLSTIQGGDHRFYNNVFVGTGGLQVYDAAVYPMQMNGNIFLMGALSANAEQGAFVLPDYNPDLLLAQKEDGIYLRIRLDKTWNDKQTRSLVTSDLLGRANIPGLPFVHPDDSPYCIDTDYFGIDRNKNNPAAGPFEKAGYGQLTFKVWPNGAKNDDF